MSMGAYIGTMILFAIPVVGWLACIIMAFAARKLNRRNLARAMLVFLIAGAVVGVALYFVFNWAANAVLEYLYEATGIVPGDLEGLGGLLDMIKGMN
jgi:L-cystine uptake protein TcyP (sodium:dicarboxylate symporter family)